MAVNDDITLAKGSVSVTLFTISEAESLKNILQVVPGVVSADNQDGGSKVATVVDLLRIQETFSFDVGITKTATYTAKQIKEQLKLIFHGANVESAPITLTYEDESIDVFFQDLVIKKVSNDNVVSTSYTGNDAMEYRATVTLVKGKLIGTPA
ncbi:MAG: hypothetical protein ACTSU7_00270 [Candidatus Heimdallarchaeaceae archaeon]